MKITFVTLCLSFLFLLAGFSPRAVGRTKAKVTSDSIAKEDLIFALHGLDARLVKKESLNEAKFISDVVPGYPVNWITEHLSVRIQATCKGNTIVAVSPSDTLNVEQKNILNTLDLGTELVVDVKYKFKLIENNDIHTTLTIVPEIEAEYPGGQKEMKEYLKGKGINKIFAALPQKYQLISIRFTVDEAGKVADAKISQTSGNPKADQSCLEAISKMPQWKPAENSKGIKVKQEFKFNIGSNSGGC